MGVNCVVEFNNDWTEKPSSYHNEEIDSTKYQKGELYLFNGFMSFYKRDGKWTPDSRTINSKEYLIKLKSRAL